MTWQSPFRAGLYDAKTYLKELSKEITQFLTIPGTQSAAAE
ncbi:hypothetical protein [Leptolyngbya sp. O-77]|nr:hypothetical protein [Leptolyngbya sp. O-77]BAU42621.1 hypothetical protein O77CONTIG1_02443 [Leptolyngbya sp. O-77]